MRTLFCDYQLPLRAKITNFLKTVQMYKNTRSNSVGDLTEGLSDVLKSPRKQRSKRKRPVDRDSLGLPIIEPLDTAKKPKKMADQEITSFQGLINAWKDNPERNFTDKEKVLLLSCEEKQIDRLNTVRRNFRKGNPVKGRSPFLLSQDFTIRKYYEGPKDLASYLKNTTPGVHNKQILIPIDATAVKVDFEVKYKKTTNGMGRICVCCSAPMEQYPSLDGNMEWIPGEQCMTRKWSDYLDPVLVKLADEEKTQQNWQGIFKDMEERTENRLEEMYGKIEEIRVNQMKLQDKQDENVSETQVREIVNEAIQSMLDAQGSGSGSSNNSGRSWKSVASTVSSNTLSSGNSSSDPSSDSTGATAIPQFGRLNPRQPKDLYVNLKGANLVQTRPNDTLKHALEIHDNDAYMAAMYLVLGDQDIAYNHGKDKTLPVAGAFWMAKQDPDKFVELVVTKDDLEEYMARGPERKEHYKQRFKDTFLFRCNERNVSAMGKPNPGPTIHPDHTDLVLGALTRSLKKLGLEITVKEDMIERIVDVTDSKHKIWVKSQFREEEEADGISARCFEVQFKLDSELATKKVLWNITRLDKIRKPYRNTEKWAKELSMMKNPDQEKYCRIREGGCGRSGHEEYECEKKYGPQSGRRRPPQTGNKNG